jgi:hypothetical protein
MEHPMHFRFLAGVLAAGGILWVIALTSFHDDLTFLIAVPGFITTAGYVFRCFNASRLSWRRWIWGVSAVTHGAWLISMICGCFFVVYTSLGRGGDIEYALIAIGLFSLWSMFAFPISIYGLRFDTRQAA